MTRVDNGCRGVTLWLLLALALPALGCGGDGPEPFILRLIADDGSTPSGPGNGIILAAVDKIQVSITPDRTMGNSFDPLMPRLFDGGDVETRVSAAGEWVITLNRAYIEDHSFIQGTTFAVDLPLIPQDTTDDPSVKDPTLQVRFQRQGEFIAFTERRLAWPIVPGEVLPVTVFCEDATRFQCLNSAPP